LRHENGAISNEGSHLGMVDAQKHTKKILLKIMLENDFKAKLNEKFTPPTIKLCQMGKSCSTCAKEMGWECWESIFNVLQPF